LGFENRESVNRYAGTRTWRIPVLIDIESEPPAVLGTFIRHTEDVALYETRDGDIREAPEDCVTVRYVEVRVPQLMGRDI
jgi:hypothetical protein